MNTNLHDTPHVQTIFRFDRLVDGELSEEERRELLAGLDNEPGGWRRCALAFLEAQCWKQAVGSAQGQTFLSAEGRQECLPAIANCGRHTECACYDQAIALAGRVGTLLAMAASFLVALGLVSWAQRVRLGRARRSGRRRHCGSSRRDRRRQRPVAQPSQPGVRAAEQSGARPVAAGDRFGRAGARGVLQSARRRARQRRRTMAAKPAAGNPRQRLAGPHPHGTPNPTAAGTGPRALAGRPAVGRARRSSRSALRRK